MGRLDRLLRPRSIAVFGGAQAAAVVEQSLKLGFSGPIWPVHPTKPEVGGVRAYRSLDDLPDAPDAAFVGVNRHLTIDIVRQLAARGAGGAVCFAAGYREAGEEGVDLQNGLVAAAGGMPIIGPNCYGLINYCEGSLLWPDQHGGVRLAEGETGVAILTQSSNIAINLTMQRRGLPIAYLLTAGNQAQTGLSEMALGLIGDERVSALGLHIEGFDSVAGFERLAAHARQLGKPVVVIKSGRSELARGAALTHTASLSGSDAAADAFLKRLGIARVHSLPAFIETLKLLHVCGPLGGTAISSMSCSGGEAGLMADAAVGRRVRFAGLTAEHRARVQDALGPMVAVSNPLDYNTFVWNREAALAAAFTAFVSDSFDFNLLVLDFPRADRCSDADWQPTVNAFEAALRANRARGAVVASLGENLPEGHARRLVAAGVAPLQGIAEAMDAVEAAAQIGTAWRSAPPLPVAAIPQAGRSKLTLDEDVAKFRLAAAGLLAPAGRRAADAGAAVEAARALGFPVAVKALGVAHKSERGAVRLALGDPRAVERAAADLLALGDGLLVERMVEGAVGELLVAVTRDPQFGPVLTIGSGGVLVELLCDSRTLLLPATPEEIESALRSLALFPLLDGYRGRRRADVAAAVRAIADLAELVVRHGNEIVETEINPLIVCGEGEGAFVADALMVVSKENRDE